MSADPNCYHYSYLDDDMIEVMDFFEEVEPTFVTRTYLRDMTNPLNKYSNKEFRYRFRFNKNIVYGTLMEIVSRRIPEPSINRGLPVPPLLQLCLALRFFATGNFQVVCGDLQGLHQTTACRIINRIAKIIAMHLPDYVNFPNDELGMAYNCEYYRRIAGFPGIIGCIDCTHIPIKSPGGEHAEFFRNCKGCMSINVQAVGGPHYKIQDIVIRWPGSAHDSRIFDNSSVKLRFDQGTLQGIILGDAGYTQCEYLFTPLQNPVSKAERRYNRAHKTTRVTIEQLFGIMKRRFACLSRKLSNKLGNSLIIIAACAVLHNIGRDDRIPEIEGEIWDLPDEITDTTSGGGFATRRGAAIREAFIERHF